MAKLEFWVPGERGPILDIATAKEAAWRAHQKRPGDFVSLRWRGRVTVLEVSTDHLDIGRGLERSTLCRMGWAEGAVFTLRLGGCTMARVSDWGFVLGWAARCFRSAVRARKCGEGYVKITCAGEGCGMLVRVPTPLPGNAVAWCPDCLVGVRRRAEMEASGI